MTSDHFDRFALGALEEGGSEPRGTIDGPSIAVPSCPQVRGSFDTIKKLSETRRDLSQQYLRSVRETLQQLIEIPNLLDRAKLERAPLRYTRNFLFGDGGMSAWAMVWAPGSATAIHDHHCSCCFAVLHGSIHEIWFNALHDGRAVKKSEAVRKRGYIACMMPSGPNIHQMMNDGPEEAISIHIYGFDHQKHASSVHREYQLALF